MKKSLYLYSCVCVLWFLSIQFRGALLAWQIFVHSHCQSVYSWAAHR